MYRKLMNYTIGSDTDKSHWLHYIQCSGIFALFGVPYLLKNHTAGSKSNHKHIYMSDWLLVLTFILKII